MMFDLTEEEKNALVPPLRVVCIVGSILLRIILGYHPYSGCATPPMFGDYEAQRHWMEITYNLPTREWYVNTTDNDLMYWGLDYPPLTAYHSWLCGAVASYMNQDWVSLGHSRGHESYTHKLFMRISVVVVDVVLYIPAILLCSRLVLKKLSPLSQVAVEALLLLQPALLVVDHGHFQYNNASLGLCLLGIVAVCRNKDVVGSVLFSLALNYKQMELYHALPFFCFLLGKSLKKKSWSSCLMHVLRLGITVILTFVLCWLPFFANFELILQVLHRLFPFARGIFEDKVANFWCTLMVFVKYREYLSLQSILRLSFVSTLLAVLPSSVHLLLRPNQRNFKFALINSSLVFFLLSFQVHEKSILLAVLPVALLQGLYPLSTTWFTTVAVLSMYPLLVKDNLVLAAWPTLVLYLLLSVLVWWDEIVKLWKFVLFVVNASLLPLCGLCVASHLISPPSKLPDLFPVMISSFSFLHFVSFALFYNWEQFFGSSWVLPANRLS